MKRRREGFTLLEIMFALVAGLIAISVVYTLNNGTTRILAEQNRVATTQTALRLAMEQIRADIERAGFLGSPNNMGETICGNSFPVQAVRFTNSQYVGNVPNAAQHLVDADGLQLMGNYVTSGAYLVGTLASSTGGSVALQTTWQSFRRDFTRPSANPGEIEIDSNAFARAFPAGRMLHIETNDHHHIYTYVSGRTEGAAGASPSAQLAINPAITPGGVCVVGLAGGATVAPLNRIEYAILNPTDATNTELAALVRLRAGEDATQRAQIEGIPSVLVRRELNEAGTPIANRTRIVLEFAVEFDLRFDLDTTSGPDTPPTILPDQANYGATPQRVRAIRVRLSARTPDTEPNLAWVARAAGDPLTRYYARSINATPTRLPSSRVRTLTSTIFVPNVAYADMP